MTKIEYTNKPASDAETASKITSIAVPNGEHLNSQNGKSQLCLKQ